ncbi:MAG TPA: hypothetical protein PLM07_15370 [Candidatus Rifleibacterium sp.]|nr:hypothetical protein [Candidatus Rifleibacterium sp.]
MKKLTGIRAAILLLAFVFAAVFTGQAASDDAKALFDRYQAVYKNYREAVDSRADAQTIKDLAAELQDACQAYYNSIGMTASFKSDDSTDPVLDGSTRSKSETENSRGGVATPRKVKSAEQKKYDALILALSAADRSNRLDSLQKQLEAFIAGCRDENLLKEATFQLADLVLERTSSLTMAQDVLLKYAKNTRNA